VAGDRQAVSVSSIVKRKNNKKSETSLWQETGRPFLSQALSKEEQALEAQILRSRIYSDLV
jgi:hypothetical protein